MERLKNKVQKRSRLPVPCVLSDVEPSIAKCSNLLQIKFFQNKSQKPDSRQVTGIFFLALLQNNANKCLENMFALIRLAMLETTNKVQNRNK